MNSTRKNLIKILIVLLISGCMFFVPFDALGVPLNDIQVRVVALFVMAALMWILEPIPIWTTSVLVITLSLLCISNQALNFFRPDRYDENAVYAIVDQACGPQADQDAVAALKEDVKKRLDKKTTLNADEVRMTLGYQIMDVSEKAGVELQKAGETQLSDDDIAKLRKKQQDFAAAATALYEPEVAESIKGLKFTNIMQQKSTMATFADPIIILFLGGFFLAAAATKYRLDVNLAKVLLKPFGTNPKYVMLGLMSVTALFAMFMSNTATAAMMLAILTPVLALFPEGDKGRTAFALCIPVAANIGGIGTPIGTPPNAIALKALQGMGLDISFGKWMLFGVPFVIVMLLISWLLLVKMFPITQKELKLEMGGKFLKTPKAIIVYVTFIATVLLWVFGGSLGLDSNTVAIVPIAVFAITQVITKEDLKAMSWDVLWLVAGGFALGLALQDTGLAKDMVNAIPFGEWNYVMLLVGASLICIFMSTFMSNTATASLLMPILAAIGLSMAPGSCTGMLVSVAIAASLGMALPISTPPNALAYATGLVSNRNMAVSGSILGVIGLTIALVIMNVLNGIGFFG